MIWKTRCRKSYCGIFVVTSPKANGAAEVTALTSTIDNTLAFIRRRLFRWKTNAEILGELGEFPRPFALSNLRLRYLIARISL